MQVDLNPLGYLREARQKAQQAGHVHLVEYFTKFEAEYDRKTWHQLSLGMEQFILLPEAAPYLIPFYENFVRDFEQKLNKLTLVTGIGLAVARQMQDNPSRIQFLLSLADRVKPEEPKKGTAAGESSALPNVEAISANLLATTQAAYYQLLCGQYDLVQAHIVNSEKQLEALDGVDSRVSSAFYRVAADFYKAKSAFAKFYKTSLLFLGCLGDITELSNEEAIERAHDLSLAALLSDEIYNFGELLMHPILDKLNKTPHEWLKNLLFAFNAGNMEVFEKLIPSFKAEKILTDNLVFLRQKICLMALIDFVFKRSAKERVISFDMVSKHTKLPLEEVEHLLMKALSLKLIRGSIDQVDGTVLVTWVTPRVLNRDQIKDMNQMLEQWTQQIDQLSKKFEEEGAELFVSA